MGKVATVMSCITALETRSIDVSMGGALGFLHLARSSDMVDDMVDDMVQGWCVGIVDWAGGTGGGAPPSTSSECS